LILAAFRAEWFKLARRPAIWVTIGLLLLLAVGIGYVVTYLVATHPPSVRSGENVNFASLRAGLYPASFVKKCLSNASTLDAIFALIIGVLAQGSEFAWGTIKTAQTQLLAISVLMAITVAGIFALDAGASYVLALLDGASTSLPSAEDIAKGAGAMWLIFEFTAIFGFALATAFKQSAMAMGLGLGYLLVIETLLFALLDNLGDTFKNLHQLFPVANAGYLQQSFGRVPGVATLVISASSPPDATHATIALAIWMAILLAVIIVLMRGRDVL
jgi:ABC-2 type transport system permease protein